MCPVFPMPGDQLQQPATGLFVIECTTLYRPYSGRENNMVWVESIVECQIWLRTDRRKDRQKDGRKDGRTDNAKTISLRLWRGIIIKRPMFVARPFICNVKGTVNHDDEEKKITSRDFIVGVYTINKKNSLVKYHHYWTKIMASMFTNQMWTDRRRKKTDPKTSPEQSSGIKSVIFPPI
ncbi:hypothetical protein DPMN_106310 [Dreissena polymorpha]|uniref:Uncharacterized protein n=1 Tax=Dreissena polymorpha TaxID=45954 RepID=A0A9D4QID4_DREPO|nr:hypothetical protein DPMN_106310 [Dreissena polymorpha]